MSFPVPARVSPMLTLAVGAVVGAAVATLATSAAPTRQLDAALARRSHVTALPPCALPPSAPSPDAGWPELTSITWTDADHARIPQRVIDRALAEPALVARGARILPSLTDGRPTGFKLYAVRPSSLYAALGLHNGDTVVAVNGLSLASPDTALDAYRRLRTADHLDLELRRRGEPLTLHYQLVE